MCAPCSSPAFGFWRGGVQDTLPQHVHWQIEYLKPMKLEKMAQEGRSLWPLCLALVPWSRLHKTLVKGALPVLGGTKMFLPPVTGNLGPRNLYTQILLNPHLSSYLLTSPNLSALSVLHKLIDSLFKGIKASCSGHFFGSSFSCEGYHVKNSPVNLSLSV